MSSETIQIDRGGRVALPKEVREQFNLTAGDRLRLSTDETGIKLEPAAAEGKFVRKGSVLVFTGEFSEPVTTEAVEKIIEEDRSRGTKEVRRKRKK